MRTKSFIAVSRDNGESLPLHAAKRKTFILRKRPAHSHFEALDDRRGSSGPKFQRGTKLNALKLTIGNIETINTISALNLTLMIQFTRNLSIVVIMM